MKARKSFMRFIHVNSSWGLLALALALAGPAQGADPILIGQWPGGPRGWKAIGVAVDDHYAYVAGSDLSGLQVFDVSNPAHPRWLSDCITGESVFGVAVSGGYAYAACYNAGLQVIDVSNPANPQWMGGYNTSGWAWDVAVSGDYAYVVNKSSTSADLQVINVSDP
ncbi:MAG: hypothetical protein KA117_13655, partial [Verrucomicrobia bacterium]|nr:hypothetical protein [Verrucomicrobiota bacterium]HOC52076.1 hypothetical protein [Verrucomicrobiota bacterium]